MRYLFKFLFRLFGWGVSGPAPTHLKKAIWVVCPHWYATDFFIGIGSRSEIGVNIGFLGKNSLFKWYSAWFFKALGGYPVDRSKANNLVQAVANTFKANDSIHVALTPEGTRKDVSELKTGFYYMALQAGVPLVLVGFDYQRKLVVFGGVVEPTGDYAKDIKPMYDFLLTIQSPQKEYLKRYQKTGEVPVK
jgi:1-acyl-sn-glycerol-3-phosphate acyltransferase